MITKLAFIAIVFAVMILYLKGINSEIALLLTICASVVFIGFAVKMLGDVFGLFERVASVGGINESVLKVVVKVAMIAYVVEFTAGIIEEFGMKSLADKLVLLGKIIIVLLAVPIFEGIMSVIEGLF